MNNAVIKLLLIIKSVNELFMFIILLSLIQTKELQHDSSRIFFSILILMNFYIIYENINFISIENKKII